MDHKQVAEIAATFGLEAFPEPSQYTPKINPDYVFRPELVDELCGFFNMERANAMWLTGLQGSGKTTLVEQFHAALNWPLITYAAHAQTTAKDLIGGLKPVAGQWVYKDGPVAIAARSGCSVLLDEYNLIEPEETSGINKILDGQHMDIEETGERLVPEFGFKLFAACNPADSSKGFFGRKEQDAANVSRFWMVEVPYPEPDAETKIVKKVLLSKGTLDDDTAEQYASQMVEVANKVRNQSMSSSSGEGALEITFSTRSLCLWAEGSLVFAGKEDNIHFALERALTRQAMPGTGTKEAIHQIATDVFGV